MNGRAIKEVMDILDAGNLKDKQTQKMLQEKYPLFDFTQYFIKGKEKKNKDEEE